MIMSTPYYIPSLKPLSSYALPLQCLIAQSMRQPIQVLSSPSECPSLWRVFCEIKLIVVVRQLYRTHWCPSVTSKYNMSVGLREWAEATTDPVLVWLHHCPVTSGNSPASRRLWTWTITHNTSLTVYRHVIILHWKEQCKALMNNFSW